MRKKKVHPAKKQYHPARAYDAFIAWLKQAPYLSLGLLAVSCAMVYGAGMQARTFANSLSSAVSVSSERMITLNRQPAGAAELEMAASFCKNHAPAITCRVESGRLKVVGDSPDKYADWVFAISSMQSYSKGMAWEAKTLCIGQCGTGAMVAELEGFTQRVEIIGE